VRRITSGYLSSLLLVVLGCGGAPTDDGGTPTLVFVQQPGGAIADSTFARQPVVEVRDDAGGLVTGTRSITIALGAHPAGGTLSGNTVATAVDGRASFADLAVDVVGSGYELTASGSGVRPATSAAFVVTGPISATTSEVTAPAPILLVSDTMTVTLRARDAAGTGLTRGGSAVSFNLSDGTTGGSFGSTVDRGDGSYTALFTSTTAGTPALVRATIDGIAVGSPAPTLAVVAFASVSAGQRHTCGVTTSHQVLCWGSNSSGQLGVAMASSTTPLQLPGSLAWTSVHAGHRNTCGLVEGGAAYCWGNNEYSQVGNGTWSVRQDEPTAVAGGLAFDRLDVGLGVTSTAVTLDQGFVDCAITAAGQGYCWGDGRFGQIGNGDVGEQAVPTVVSGGIFFGSVAAGAMHSCGIATNGQPFCWGVNANGQLGIGSSSLPELCDGLACSTTPRSVNTTRVFDSGSISVGTDHSCGISGGLAYCWGANRFGALGDGTGTARTSPVAVSGGVSFSKLTAGDAMTCGLATSGSTYCWGKVSGGTTVTSSLVPAVISGSVSFEQIDAGGSHACGTTAEGAVYCWGSNTFGQLGSGTITSSAIPVRIKLR
jgi:alpha-tubulin suppressor-like RCC1 family protein